MWLKTSLFAWRGTKPFPAGSALDCLATPLEIIYGHWRFAIQNSASASLLRFTWEGNCGLIGRDFYILISVDHTLLNMTQSLLYKRFIMLNTLSNLSITTVLSSCLFCFL